MKLPKKFKIDEFGQYYMKLGNLKVIATQECRNDSVTRHRDRVKGWYVLSLEKNGVFIEYGGSALLIELLNYEAQCLFVDYKERSGKVA